MFAKYVPMCVILIKSASEECQFQLLDNCFCFFFYFSRCRGCGDDVSQMKQPDSARKKKRDSSALVAFEVMSLKKIISNAHEFNWEIWTICSRAACHIHTQQLPAKLSVWNSPLRRSVTNIKNVFLLPQKKKHLRQRERHLRAESESINQPSAKISLLSTDQITELALINSCVNLPVTVVADFFFFFFFTRHSLLRHC